MRRTATALMLIVACWLAPAGGGGCAWAHELPERVTVRMIAAFDDATAALMVRVPLEAMRDVDFPLTPEGYLVIDEAEAALREAADLWIVDGLVLRDRGRPVVGTRVQARLALPGDRAFADAAAARAHFAAPPLDPATLIYWRQALLDVRIVYPLGSASTDPRALTLDVAMRHLGAVTRVEMLLVDPDGRQHALTFDGDTVGLPLLPGWGRIARDFVVDGVVHIVGGLDHLLFLVCLVLPIRRVWPLVKAVTGFTVAHSITLGAAALGAVPDALWFPSLVESLIAASIVVLAIDNALRPQAGARVAAAFGFGLAHGFGFASVLQESLQFAQGHRLVALAGFNLGVEFGQLAVLIGLVPGVALLMRHVPSQRLAVIVISALVGHTGWHWLADRFTIFAGYF